MNGIAWALVAPRLLQASVIHDPSSPPASEGVTTSVTVLGNFARARFVLDLQGITLTA